MKNSGFPQARPGVSAFHEGEQQARMTIVIIRDLLQARGYEIVHRYGHLHATKDGNEWHLCLMADSAALSPAQVLAHLDDALAYCLTS